MQLQLVVGKHASFPTQSCEFNEVTDSSGDTLDNTKSGRDRGVVTRTAWFCRAIKFIKELRAIGCRFALDDFGSGMSSFAYLKNLPVNYLKIDGSFIKDMETDQIDCAMVRAINDIAHKMNIQTIAEFVENHVILGMLKQIHVDYAQGFGIAKPKPVDELDIKADLARSKVSMISSRKQA